MNKNLQLGAVLCLLAGVVVMGAVAVKKTAAATTPEKFIHVRVNDASKGEMVSVNVPLSLAEKVIPTIHNGNLRNGKVTIGNMDMQDVDVRALLTAVASSPDNEFVTVKEKDQEVRVAKSKGNFIIHVTDLSSDSDESDKSAKPDKSNKKHGQNVDITIPISVVNALVPNEKQELDLVAAIRALSNASEALLVTVHDGTQDVKIWIDSQNDGSK
ncbi:MAG TPA: hypothetical protein VIH76_19515 [Candidatus Acidoferrales bacterium]